MKKDNDDYKEALGHYRKASEITPNDEDAWGGLHHALLGIGLFEDAFNLGQEILRQWPDYDDVRVNMATAALNMGWNDEAEKEYLDVLSRDQDDAFSHAAVGICYARGGKKADARWHQHRALELDRDDPEIKQMCADIDRILDGDGGPSPDELNTMLMTMLAVLASRAKKNGHGGL